MSDTTGYHNDAMDFSKTFAVSQNPTVDKAILSEHGGFELVCRYADLRVPGRSDRHSLL
jgi:hypothetical protein